MASRKARRGTGASARRDQGRLVGIRIRQGYLDFAEETGADSPEGHLGLLSESRFAPCRCSSPEVAPGSSGACPTAPQSIAAARPGPAYRALVAERRSASRARGTAGGGATAFTTAGLVRPRARIAERGAQIGAGRGRLHRVGWSGTAGACRPSRVSHGRGAPARSHHAQCRNRGF
jgi:hypothetical protein